MALGLPPIYNGTGLFVARPAQSPATLLIALNILVAIFGVLIPEGLEGLRGDPLMEPFIEDV